MASFLRLLTTFISQQHGFKPEELVKIGERQCPEEVKSENKQEKAV